MQIRLATKKDISAITALKGIEDNERYSQRIVETENGRTAYMLTEFEDQIVGQVFLKFYGTIKDSSIPSMEDLLVNENSRNKGIGTALIQECERLSKEKGYTKIGLSVNPNLNKKAKSLYEKLGYVNLGKESYLDGVYNGVEDWVIDLVKTI